MDQIKSAHDPTVDTNGNQFLDEEDWRKRRALRDALDEATKNSGGLSTSSKQLPTLPSRCSC